MALVDGVGTPLGEPMRAEIYSFTATYLGDASHLAATSPPMSTTVSRHSPVITLGSSDSPGIPGHAITFGATVQSIAGFVPTGTATISGGGLSCAITVEGGTGTCLLAFPAIGTYALTAEYSGDANYTPASSVAWTQSIVCASAGQADTDCDGLPDATELAVGRNPWSKDNDVFTSGTLFAMQMYRDFLEREGDAAGVSVRAGWLDGGTLTRAQMAQSFYDQAEFQWAAAPVARLYFAFFDRFPDYAGFQGNVGLLKAGSVTLDGLANYFAASPEFLAAYGALDDVQYVTLLYRNVLGREPDEAGLAGWVGFLGSGSYTRGQVMLGFSESQEYRARVDGEVYVSLMYIAMLRRAPDAAGFAGWVGMLAGGTPRLALIDGFIGSVEYRARFLP